MTTRQRAFLVACLFLAGGCGDDGGGSTSSVGDAAVGRESDTQSTDNSNQIDPDEDVDCSALPEGEILYSQEDEDDPSNLDAVGGYLYHSTQFEVYRTPRDGASGTELIHDQGGAIAAFEDRVYVANLGEGLVRMNPDGTEVREVFGEPGILLKDGDALFLFIRGYCNSEDKPGRIYRIDGDDTVTTIRDDLQCLESPAIEGDDIYLVIEHEDRDREEDQSLYRIPKTGGEAEEMPLWVDNWNGFVPDMEFTEGYLIGRRGSRYVRGRPTDSEAVLIAPSFMGPMAGFDNEVFISGKYCIGVVRGEEPVEYLAQYQGDSHSVEQMTVDDEYVYYSGNNFEEDRSVIRRFKYR